MAKRKRVKLHTLPPKSRVQKLITLTAGALRKLRDMGEEHGHSAAREAEVAINKHVGIDEPT